MKSQPPYKTPLPEDQTARVPRVVNAAWLVQALRDQVRALDRGDWLPWDSADLCRRAATQLEQLTRRR